MSSILPAPPTASISLLVASLILGSVLGFGILWSILRRKRRRREARTARKYSKSHQTGTNRASTSSDRWEREELRATPKVQQAKPEEQLVKPEERLVKAEEQLTEAEQRALDEATDRYVLEHGLEEMPRDLVEMHPRAAFLRLREVLDSGESDTADPPSIEADGEPR